MKLLVSFFLILCSRTAFAKPCFELSASSSRTSKFAIGGNNSSDSIKELKSINGVSIQKLEERMRPGFSSSTYEGSEWGFLGKTESLIAILIADHKTVTEQMGLSHRRIAEPLFLAIRKSGGEDEPNEFTFGNHRYSSKLKFWLGSQESPFDDGLSADYDVLVTDLATGRQLKFSGLLPEFIRRYGFYEGKGSREAYRTHAEQIIARRPLDQQAEWRALAEEGLRDMDHRIDPEEIVAFFRIPHRGPNKAKNLEQNSR